MPRGKTKRGPHKKKRRWSPTPPLIRDADSPGPEGLSIIGELPSPVGGLLWKTYRSVLLWADAEPEERVGLFGSQAAVRRRREMRKCLDDDSRDLEPPLETILRMLDSPESVTADEVSQAARRIATWARSAEASHTELDFLRVAAVADPTNPRLALAAAVCARDRMQPAMAEAWFFRAIGLARRVPDWDVYTDAYLGHGTMMLQKGALASARESFIKAYRRAVRQGKTDPKGRSLHKLFTLEMAAENLDNAAKYAEESAVFLGSGHPDLEKLARDVAALWIRKGYFPQARTLLAALSENVSRVHLPQVLGALARAAGGAGDEKTFQQAWRRLEKLSGGPGTAEAWLEVGRGALHLEHAERAVDAAESARRLGRQIPGSQVGFLADILEETARSGGSPAEVADDPDGRQAALADKLASMVNPVP